MTDIDKIMEMLTAAGIGYRSELQRDDQRAIYIDEGTACCAKWFGYSGFAAGLLFSSSGALIKVGAWE